ncbi:MAG: helix-turn-helix transcriptional regulator [Bacteroidales bacterium]|nr:helix-turn-helix transcriptional regulator [Bacteroidales bacterium]
MDAKKDFHTLDDLYISPFTSVRYYDDNGQPRYRPLERNLHPTGLYAADLLLQSLTLGRGSLSDLARRLGCSSRDLSGLIRCLTGQPSDQFRTAYRKRLVTDLLRFTDLPLPDIAARSGIGRKRNLHLFTNLHFGCTPEELRHRIRQVGDAGRFGVELRQSRL